MDPLNKEIAQVGENETDKLELTEEQLECLADAIEYLLLLARREKAVTEGVDSEARPSATAESAADESPQSSIEHSTTLENGEMTGGFLKEGGDQ